MKEIVVQKYTNGKHEETVLSCLKKELFEVEAPYQKYANRIKIKQKKVDYENLLLIAKQYILELEKDTIQFVSYFDNSKYHDGIGIKIITANEKSLFIDLPFRYNDFLEIKKIIDDLKNSSYINFIDQALEKQKIKKIHIGMDDKVSGVKMNKDVLYVFIQINNLDKNIIKFIISKINKMNDFNDVIVSDYREGTNYFCVTDICEKFNRKNSNLCLEFNNKKAVFVHSNELVNIFLKELTNFYNEKINNGLVLKKTKREDI